MCCCFKDQLYEIPEEKGYRSIYLWNRQSQHRQTHHLRDSKRLVTDCRARTGIFAETINEQHQESWLFRHFWKWCNVTDVTLANFGKYERLQHVTSPWHTLAFQDWVVTGRWAKTNESGSCPDRQPNVPLFIQSWWFFLGQHRVAWKSSWFVLLWLNADAQSALCSFDVFFFLTVELAHVFFCFHTFMVHSRSVCFVSYPEPSCCAFKMFWRVFCSFRVSSSSIQCQLSISSKWQRSIQHLHIPALISTQTPRPVTVPSSSHFFLQVYTDTGYKYKDKVCCGKTPCLGASFVLIVRNVYSRICLIEYLGIFHVLWTSLYFSIAIM